MGIQHQGNGLEVLLGNTAVSVCQLAFKTFQ